MCCEHHHITQGQNFGFYGSIPGVEENRTAHGCVTYVETCSDCGAERRVNQNQWHYEFGPWGPDLATRKEQERLEVLERLQEQEQRIRDLQLVEAAPRIELGQAFAQQDSDGLLTLGSSVDGLPQWWVERAQAYRRAQLEITALLGREPSAL